MKNLHNYLPKDLVNIIEEYSKDRTNYDKVLREFETSIIITLSDFADNFNIPQVCYGSGYYCHCDDVETFKEMKERTPKCHSGHMKLLRDINQNKNHSHNFFHILISRLKD